MPLDPRIPMGFRSPEFANPLDMALKGGKLAALMQGQQANELLMQQKQQERDVMNQYRQGIAALGPDATPENMLSVALKSGAVGPKDLASIVSTNENKKLALQQQVWSLKLRHDYRMSELETRLREGRITKEEADARAADLRRDLEAGRQEAARELHGMDARNREGLLRLGASLRPAPAAEPLEKVVGPDGAPIFAPRREAIGKRPWTPETSAERKAGDAASQSAVTLQSVEDRVKKMSDLIKGGSVAGGVVGPLGLAGRLAETARGTVQPGTPTPSLDYQNEMRLLLSDVRKLIEKDPNLSKDEREALYETMGGGILQTPGSAIRTLNNVVEKVRSSAIRGQPKTSAREDTFTSGQIYVDAKGNRAKYLGNGKWEQQ